MYHLTPSTRIESLDLVRGVIMLLMAIDHVRVYSGIPAGGADAAVFFTRWITHFCAPGFVFLAGTAAFLFGQKVKDLKVLTRFLMTRGSILILFELTVIRFCWTFNFQYGEFLLAGVIWMLGCCMILLSGLIWFGPRLVGLFGALIILFQHSFSFVPGLLPDTKQQIFARFWEFVYPAGFEGPQGITILYVLVPWIGVMACGYAFGLIMIMGVAQRKKWCLILGSISVLLFLSCGTWIALQTPVGEDTPPFLFRLLNQRKYPASLLYLLMTLGPILVCIPLADKIKNSWSLSISTIGRVPMFYYLLHIPLIHLSALLVNIFREGQAFGQRYATAPYTFLPESERWNLGLLYLVCLLDVVVLFFLCKWYAAVKWNRPAWWMKYI